jgi:alanyl-tRNA synthetase
VEVIREAAAVVGGGGGGRPEVAQAGGRQPERLDEALETARAALARALS